MLHRIKAQSDCKNFVLCVSLFLFPHPPPSLCVHLCFPLEEQRNKHHHLRTGRELLPTLSKRVSLRQSWCVSRTNPSEQHEGKLRSFPCGLSSLLQRAPNSGHVRTINRMLAGGASAHTLASDDMSATTTTWIMPAKTLFRYQHY